MESSRSQLIHFIEQDIIAGDRIDNALVAARISPGGREWRAFVDHLLLWLGALALAFSVLFFVAYNWDEIGRFAKFGLVEILIIVAVSVFLLASERELLSKVALLVATILLGVLLALYGQTYQTGADTWQLFFNWALLMLPWALVGRFAAIWVVWIAIVDTSIVLYHQVSSTLLGGFWGSDTSDLWELFLFNTLVLFSWEFLSRHLKWLATRWALRLLALASGIPITWLVLHAIAYPENGSGLAGLLWVLWLVALIVIYRIKTVELFTLAGCCMSGIIVFTAFLAKNMLHHPDAGSYLLIALLVIAQGAAAAFWLERIHREVHA